MHRVKTVGPCYRINRFVTSRVDYCNSVLASASKTITDELQRVPQHVWSPAPAGTTVVCQHYFTMNCTGSTSLSECSTSLQRLSTGVSGIKHRPTSPITMFQCPTLPVAGACYPPAAINWLFHVSAAAPSVVAPSLLLVLQSWIHCLRIRAIQLLGQTSFDGTWKPTCLPVVSVLLI